MSAPGLPRLLEAMDRTWPAAERVQIGDWVVRRGLGAGQRVSSVWPRGEPGLPLAEALARAAEIQRAWGERPLVQVSAPGGALDVALEAQGWEIADPSLIMAGNAEALARQGTAGRMVVQVRAPLAVLDEIWEQGGIGAARRAVMARVDVPHVRLLLREDDRPVAAAFVAVDGDVAMLHGLIVAAPFRRRGLGRGLTSAAAHWAVAQGAGWLGLAVASRNGAAISLYRGMGFDEAGRYHYREWR